MSTFGSAALAIPLFGCGGSADGFATPQARDTFFTLDYTLPQTQSAAQLATFLETQQLQHDINGWYFFGSLRDDAIRPGIPGEFTLSVERVALGAATGTNPMRVIASSMDRGIGHWELAAFAAEDATGLITNTANPWSFVMRSPVPGAPPLVSMQALSGRLGQPGADYLLEVALPLVTGQGVLSARVRLHDAFGVINQGYGTTAFAVGNLTGAQRDAIVSAYGGSVQSYLESTGDPMIDQGEFYYQMPMLQVTEFSVARDAAVLNSGAAGLVWADIIAATYDERAIAAYQGMVSRFFAIQVPELHTVLMVLRIDSANGTVATATQYDDSSATARNGARNFAYSWPMTGISIEPDPASNWVSPLTGNAYPLVYRIRLDSAQRHAQFTITMVTANQEVPVSTEPTYAGLAGVAGSLGGLAVGGQAFVEIWTGLKS